MAFLSISSDKFLSTNLEERLHQNKLEPVEEVTVTKRNHISVFRIKKQYLGVFMFMATELKAC